MKRFVWLIFLLLAACAPLQPAAAQNGIEILAPQVRVAGTGPGTVAAAYLQIRNTGAETDRLVGAACDFADASLHETRLEGDVMTMDAVEAVAIPAGALLELRSGSYHVMFSNLSRELHTGEVVIVLLKFERAGQIPVPARVSR